MANSFVTYNDDTPDSGSARKSRLTAANKSTKGRPAASKSLLRAFSAISNLSPAEVDEVGQDDRTPLISQAR